MPVPSMIEDQLMGNVTVDHMNASLLDPGFFVAPKCAQFQTKNGTLSVVNVISYCYVLPTVCAIGILGNVANLITLASGRLKAVSYMYLRGLGIADMLCMIFVLIFVSFEMISASANYRHLLTSYGVVWFRAHLMLPLINWPVSAGILIVLALTLERYISIAWPILFREWNSPKRATIIITAAYIFSMVLYIPMCWQHEVVPLCPAYVPVYMDPNISAVMAGYNGTAMTTWVMRQNDGWGSTDNSLLMKHKGYVAYKYTREGILKIIPIVALTFLNLQIIIAFKKVRKRRRRLNTSANQTAREQRSLLFLLAGIVVLFFVCNIPAAVNLIFITDAMKAKTSYVIFRAVANLLEITNHALNFYNFCLCSSDYRQTFFTKFPCVKRMQESAEDIKRRVSNSVARVQASRGTSFVVNNHPPETQSFAVSSSLKSSTSAGAKRPPLRRALSTDALLKLNHRQLKDDYGRRFGHHYGASKYCPPVRYLGVRNSTRLRVGYKRCDSFQSFLENNFEAIPEDYNPSPEMRIRGGGLVPPSQMDFFLSDLSMNDYQDGAVSTLALVDFEANTAKRKLDDVTDSSLTYISADYANDAISEKSGSVEQGKRLENGLGPGLNCLDSDTDSDDTLTYSSANDVYL